MVSPFVPVYSADRALRAVQDRVQRATTSPAQSPALRTESFDAAAGATYRVRPTTSATLEVRLPKADASNYGKTVTLLIDRPVSTVRVLCPTGTVNGATALTYCLTGARSFASDGDGGWIADTTEGFGAVSVNTTLPTATNATTNLSCGGTYSVCPDVWAAGTLFRFTGVCAFDHTASATPQIIVELLIGGAVVTSLTMTPMNLARVFDLQVAGFMRCQTTGVGGTVMCTITQVDSFVAQGAGIASHDHVIGERGTTTTTLNTTIENDIEMRVRMVTAVAANTLTVTQGFVERLA